MLFLVHDDFSYILSEHLYVIPELVQTQEQNPLLIDTMWKKPLLLPSDPFGPALSGDGLLKSGLL